MFIFYLLWK